MPMRPNQFSMLQFAFAVAAFSLPAMADSLAGQGSSDSLTVERARPGSVNAVRLAAAAGDALPKSKDALFDDDAAEPAEVPATRDSLFDDDESSKTQKPAVGGRSAPAAPAGIRGFVQNEMAYTVAKPRHWSAMMTRADVTAQGNLASNVKWKLGARVDYDANYALTDYYPHAVARDQRANVLLRENYIDIGAGDWDFRLGRQHVVWGEMVGLFFADVVSARDMRQFILPEFDILRIPQWAARAEYFRDDFHAEFLWIPVPSYDEIGKPYSEFFAHTLVPPGSAVFRNEKRPSRSLSHTNYGLRLSVLRDGWDLAAFAYSSMNVAPTFYRQNVANAQPTLVYQGRHERIDQFGATLGKDLGRVVIKAEAVYTRGQRYEVKGFNDPDGLVRQDTLNWILGLDYTEFTDTRINLQLFQSHVIDHNSAIIPDRNENGFSVLFNRKFGDRVEAQALWIASLNRTDWLLRPRVLWNFEKNWRLALGADVFKGPALGFFGRYDAKDRVYTELRYSF